MKEKARGIFLSKRPQIIEALKKRSRIISSMRYCLEHKGLYEVETPILCTHREGGPFVQLQTQHPITGKKYFLSFCPEDRLKRICSLFTEGVFEFARCFRPEADSDTHLSEFTMLEIKQPNKSMKDQIELAFSLIQHSVLEVFGTLVTDRFNFSDLNVVSCYEMVKNVVGLNIFDKAVAQKALALLEKAGVDVKNHSSEWEIMDKLFKHFIEPQMKKLSFLTEFPLVLSTISRVDHERQIANRFQIMLGGVEIGDGGEKMLGSKGYKTLYEANSRYRREFLGVEENNGVCEDFLADMEIASPMAGFGIGVDRFVSLLLGLNISDVLLFPKTYDCC